MTMIDLYYDLTPNGRKIHMLLEELDLPYTVHWIDVKKGDQFTPEYAAINPNNKIPAIIDRNGPGEMPMALFESGAIMQYLAEKSGRLLPTDSRERWEAICWVYWQVANQGPAGGNAAHFVQYAPSAGIIDEYASLRYVTETERCCAVLDARLEDREFLVGEQLTIADLICFPWTRVLKGQRVDIAQFPNVKRWSAKLASRPSARAKVEKPDHDVGPPKGLSPEAFKSLFGVDPSYAAVPSPSPAERQKGSS